MDARGVTAQSSCADQRSDGTSCLLLRSLGQGTLQWKLPRGAWGHSTHPPPACLSVFLACLRQDLGVCFKDSGFRIQESQGWSVAGNEACGCQHQADQSSEPPSTTSWPVAFSKLFFPFTKVGTRTKLISWSCCELERRCVCQDPSA